MTSIFWAFETAGDDVKVGKCRSWPRHLESYWIPPRPHWQEPTAAYTGTVGFNRYNFVSHASAALMRTR